MRPANVHSANSTHSYLGALAVQSNYQRPWGQIEISDYILFRIVMNFNIFGHSFLRLPERVGKVSSLSELAQQPH